MRRAIEAFLAVAIVTIGGSVAVVLTGAMPEAVDTPARRIVAAVGLGPVVFEGEASVERADSEGGGGRRGRGATVITTSSVRVEPFVDRIHAVGTGRAGESVTVATSVAGRVATVHFVSNGLVEAGDPLVTLERDAEAIAVTRAEAQFAQANAANSRYQRASQGSGTFSSAQIEDVSTALAVAEAALREAEFEFDRREIRAPFGGRVGLDDLAVGEYLSAGDAVVTLDDTSALEVEFLAPESKAAYALVGTPVRATSPAMPGQVFRGEIAAVDSRIDAQTRTLRVRALIPNPDDLLRPGITFSITVPIEGESLPIVPALAVQWSREGASVWRLRDGAIERVPVVIRKRDGDDVYVEAALEHGDIVAVEGAQKLNPNSTVTVEDGETPERTEVRFVPRDGSARAASSAQSTQ